MAEEIPENVRKLAATLRKSGLAVSEIDALEKAKSAIKAEAIIQRTQHKVIHEILKETGVDEAQPTDDEKKKEEEPPKAKESETAPEDDSEESTETEEDSDEEE